MIRTTSWITGTLLSVLLLLPDRAAPSGHPDPEPPYLAASMRWLPASGIDHLTPGTELAGNEHQLSLGLFRFETETVSIDVGVDYEYVRYEYTNVDSRNRDLHRLQIPVRFDTGFESWRLRGHIAPGVSTSSNVFKDYLNRGSSDDAFVTGRAAMHRGTAAAEWFLGVAFDRSFGEPRAYPVAGVELTPTPALRLRLAFPDPGFTLQVSERQSLQGSVFPAGHQWRVVTDDFARDFDYRLETLRTQLNWNVRVWRRLSVDLTASFDTGREHRFADNQGVPLRFDVASDWLFAVGIRLGAAELPRAHGVAF
ncbi:MAG: hypothetical protein QNJ11_10345 [Woeseiaceae bacterium]|nr:hypothetical protein [Woeseiaceae bacterium]